MSKYRVWENDVIDTEVEAESMNDALDIASKELGYIDHVDMCQERELEESPFNIKEIQ